MAESWPRGNQINDNKIQVIKRQCNCSKSKSMAKNAFQDTEIVDKVLSI